MCHLERDAPAEHEDAIGDGDLREQRPAEEFIEGVVAAYVFADGEQCAVGRKERAGVEPAGAAEDGLVFPELRGQCVEDAGGDFYGGNDGREIAEDLPDGGDSAEAATGVGKDGALVLRGAERGRAAEHGIYHRAVFDEVGEVVGAADDSFAEQPARSQLAVLARRAHGDGEGLAFYAEFERCFLRDFIGTGAGELTVFEAEDFDFHRWCPSAAPMKPLNSACGWFGLL